MAGNNTFQLKKVYLSLMSHILSVNKCTAVLQSHVWLKLREKGLSLKTKAYEKLCDFERRVHYSPSGLTGTTAHVIDEVEEKKDMSLV